MFRLLTLFFVFITLSLPTGAQTRIASVDETGRVMTKYAAEDLVLPTRRRSTPSLLAGFPLALPADAAFKNFRNVTLHDLDKDGAAELIFGSANRLYCYRGSLELWSAQLSGNNRFPAAIGDLDGDGQEEIVVTTGFNNEAGGVYVFDKDGSPVAPWPMTYGGQWKLSSPSLADVDGDGDLEIAFGDLQGTVGSLHLVHHDGSVFAGDWPQDLPNIPAVTPSIGDMDRDGIVEIVTCTTREIYSLTPQGETGVGWPVASTGTKYSFQSPVLVDFNADGNLDVVGTGHGDNPHYYVYDEEGSPQNGWPIPIPYDAWSFHPPTIFSYQGEITVINAKPGTSAVQDMLFARNPDGTLKSGYPIRQQGGHEGVTTVADVDGDGDPDLVFSTNLITTGGEGLIYAYDFLSGSLLAGYPLVQRGWTYMNGATFGDLDGDGNLEMVVLTYTENEGSIPDTTFVYAYDLQVPAERVWWSTYKGSNDRTGVVDLDQLMSDIEVYEPSIHVFPNPAQGTVHLEVPLALGAVNVQLYDAAGMYVRRFENINSALNISSLFPGIYFLEVSDGINRFLEKVIIY